VTSAAAFVEVFIPVVRDHGGNSACASMARERARLVLQRLVRIGIVRLGVLHYLLRGGREPGAEGSGLRKAKKKRTHAHQDETQKKNPNADSQGPVMRMLDRFVVVGIH
jgi:hypothetical protein